MNLNPTVIWKELLDEARSSEKNEPLLAAYLRQKVLQVESLELVLAGLLSDKLSGSFFEASALRFLLSEIYTQNAEISGQIYRDLASYRQRDPACPSYMGVVLFYKGFQALTAYRASHYIWNQGRLCLAAALQSAISEHLGVDIHPAAKIGSGIMIDHATGVVIGETAVVEDDVSLLHAVTLGGTGKERGDRHPKVRQGVLIGAGAKILGNVEIGKGSKVGAGSVVLKDVPPHSTVVGVPAVPTGCPRVENPALVMDHKIEF